MTWNPARIRLSIIRFPGLLLMSSTALLAGGCGPATTTHQIRGTYPPEPLHAHLPTVEAKSCNGVSTYRDLPPPPPPPAYPSCELWHHSAERLTNGHEEESLVRIIEFNDEGEVNETQRDAALRDIRATITAAGRGLVVVFAHGWHHGAQVCDDNLACFRRALMGLHSAQKTIDGMNHDGKRTDPAPVIGVFLAWRGEEFERFPGKQLSLFSRKGIAQRIGRNGARETLDRLDGLYRDLRASLETEGEDRRVRMISVGHSLGGAMLFTALQSKVQVRENGRRVLKLGEDGLPQGFGDMMVLVNPAVEAWEYKPFHRYSRSRNRVTRRADAPPILVSVGSTADQAVGAYFPIARLVQSLWHPTRPFRGVSNFLAMGRYWLHTSHHLNWKGDGWGKKKRRREDKSRCECPRDVQSSTQEAGDSGQLSGDFELLHEDWWKDGDPFMVVNAGRRVISDHGDIFNPRFVKFLMDQFVTAPAERQKRERLAGQPSLASRR